MRKIIVKFYNKKSLTKYNIFTVSHLQQGFKVMMKLYIGKILGKRKTNIATMASYGYFVKVVIFKLTSPTFTFILNLFYVFTAHTV